MRTPKRSTRGGVGRPAPPPPVLRPPAPPPAASAESVATATEGADATSEAETLAAQRLDDLQRLNAEYVNYKRRVDRDALTQERAVTCLEALLPVLDDIQSQDHGDPDRRPVAATPTNSKRQVRRYGLTRFGDEVRPRSNGPRGPHAPGLARRQIPPSTGPRARRWSWCCSRATRPATP